MRNLQVAKGTNYDKHDKRLHQNLLPHLSEGPDLNFGDPKAEGPFSEAVFRPKMPKRDPLKESEKVYGHMLHSGKLT